MKALKFNTSTGSVTFQINGDESLTVNIVAARSPTFVDVRIELTEVQQNLLAAYLAAEED